MILYLFLNVKSVRVHKMENFAKFQFFLQFILRIKGKFAQEYWYLPFFSSFFVKIPLKWLIL